LSGGEREDHGCGIATVDDVEVVKIAPRGDLLLRAKMQGLRSVGLSFHVHARVDPLRQVADWPPNCVVHRASVQEDVSLVAPWARHGIDEDQGDEKGRGPLICLNARCGD